MRCDTGRSKLRFYLLNILINRDDIIDKEMLGILTESARLCIEGEGLDPSNAEISLSFVSLDEIHELNRLYRGVDRPTDVLSFPLIDDISDYIADVHADSEEAKASGGANPQVEGIDCACTNNLKNSGNCDSYGEADRGEPETSDCFSEESSDEFAYEVGEGEGALMLGDIVICLDKVKEQAEEFGHSRKREMVYLFTHSMLHLLGYDHMEPEEKTEMRKREEEIMQLLEINR